MKRSYDEACAVAHALDLVGERWAMLVVRELVLGAKRFTDLRASMPAISPNVLSQRLSDLEDVGVIQRRKLAPPAGSWVYELTAWGAELGPVLHALARWGVRSPSFAVDAYMGTTSFILSFSVTFDSVAAGDLEVTAELRVGDETFTVRVASGAVRVARGSANATGAADILLAADDARTLAAVVYGGRSVTDAVASNEVYVEGRRALVRRFLSVFRLPPATES